MPSTLRILMVACLCACGPSQVTGAVRDLAVESDCATDPDCPTGMVCEGCAGEPRKQCIPGCRSDASCYADQICSLTVQCSTCPCAPGWCVRNPCLDLDSDGYVQSADPTVVCPGKKLGDCDDTNKWVHPGAKELCGNYLDDDCDGKEDTQAGCRQCTSYYDRCSSSFDCVRTGGFCDNGCCAACPAIKRATCDVGTCAVEGAFNTDTGCKGDEVCRPCATCGTEVVEVCGIDFTTYPNACIAAQAQVAILHRGACLTREGEVCVPSAQRCDREGILSCRQSDAHCTKIGTCNVDSDCPNGITSTPFCSDGKIPPYYCGDHECKVRCDP